MMPTLRFNNKERTMDYYRDNEEGKESLTINTKMIVCSEVRMLRVGAMANAIHAHAIVYIVRAELIGRGWMYWSCLGWEELRCGG
jgi:hypothetical protein